MLGADCRSAERVTIRCAFDPATARGMAARHKDTAGRALSKLPESPARAVCAALPCRDGPICRHTTGQSLCACASNGGRPDLRRLHKRRWATAAGLGSERGSPPHVFAPHMATWFYAQDKRISAALRSRRLGKRRILAQRLCLQGLRRGGSRPSRLRRRGWDFHDATHVPSHRIEPAPQAPGLRSISRSEKRAHSRALHIWISTFENIGNYINSIIPTAVFHACPYSILHSLANIHDTIKSGSARRRCYRCRQLVNFRTAIAGDENPHLRDCVQMD